MKIILALATLLIGGSSFAQLPSGFYSGFVNNNSFRDLCSLNRGEIEFIDQGNGNYQVRWQEQGYFQAPASGFCQNIFDASFSPSKKENEWNVNFYYGFDWSFGRAVLKGDILTITANYTGPNRALQRLTARIRINNNHSLNYNRIIDLWGGSSLYASGIFH